MGFCSAAACGSRIGLGVPAASMFCEHLADADDAALMRLVMMCLLRRHPFEGVYFLSATFRPEKRPLSWLSTLKTPSRPEKQAFLWTTAPKQLPIHEIAQFHGQDDLRAPGVRPVYDGSQIVTKKPLRRVALYCLNFWVG